MAFHCRVVKLWASKRYTSWISPSIKKFVWREKLEQAGMINKHIILHGLNAQFTSNLKWNHMLSGHLPGYCGIAPIIDQSVHAHVQCYYTPHTRFSIKIVCWCREVYKTLVGACENWSGFTRMLTIVSCPPGSVWSSWSVSVFLEHITCNSYRRISHTRSHATVNKCHQCGFTSRPPSYVAKPCSYMLCCSAAQPKKVEHVRL